MARKALSVPSRQRLEGVWYYPDIDDNQTLWVEYCGLRSIPTLTEAGAQRLAELEALIPGLFAVRIGSYSHDEFVKIEGGARRKALNVSVDQKSQKVSFDGDPMAMGEQVLLDVCRDRIFEVRGYSTTEAVLAGDGEPIRLASGEMMTETREITTGPELVAFIREKAELEERAVLDDIFQAIKSRSHLSRGEKKVWPSRPAS